MDQVRIITNLIQAGLRGDRRKIEALALMAVKKLRRSNHEAAESISKMLSYSDVGLSPTRSLGIVEPPKEDENYLPLALVDSEPVLSIEPIFPESVRSQVHAFLRERKYIEQLLASGVSPARSILLHGPPGVGKTLLAAYVAAETECPLISLDLATAVSSYLGRTGQNLRKILDYARDTRSVLLLDEFDAIAKKRDDPTDLGELKRIVNVLLKELENWPAHSILIASTNHPELLDKAIWRRFDRIIKVGLPGMEERKKLFRSYLSQIHDSVDNRVIEVMASAHGGLSPADISKISERAHRKLVLDGGDINQICLEEFLNYCRGDLDTSIGEVVRLVRRNLGEQIGVRELASWLGRSPSTISYHINKEGRSNE